jgi:acetyltransferase-like isoleucine patch superfamily enzyme
VTNYECGDSPSRFEASSPVIGGKLKRFWRQPFFNKLHDLSNLYYKLKGILFYRWLFERFGTGSYIRKPILILGSNFMSIGKNVGIRDGVRLEVIPSTSRSPRLVIEDDTNIEQNVHIVCHSYVHIGSKVSITGNCSIVDVTHPFTDVSSPVKVGSRIEDEDSFVEIGEGAFIGMGAVILPNVRIGKHAVIGANSVVNRDVPDYSVAAGAPAIVLKQYDFKKEAWVRVSSTTNSRIVNS